MDGRKGSEIFSCKALDKKNFVGLAHIGIRTQVFAFCGRKEMKLI